jgi:hypothetical protein
MVKYFRPVSQSSESSVSTAVIRRSRDASLGNSVATCVRRFISLFRRSRRFLVRAMVSRSMLRSTTLSSPTPRRSIYSKRCSSIRPKLQRDDAMARLHSACSATMPRLRHLPASGLHHGILRDASLYPGVIPSCSIRQGNKPHDSTSHNPSCRRVAKQRHRTRSAIALAHLFRSQEVSP